MTTSAAEEAARDLLYWAGHPTPSPAPFRSSDYLSCISGRILLRILKCPETSLALLVLVSASSGGARMVHRLAL
ncbi:hypothetical protein MTO96_013031 [Rhipicephalus appendiculatus]